MPTKKTPSTKRKAVPASKITKSVVENTVKSTVGEDVIPLIDYLKDKKNISEFQIAQSLKTEVNYTRNMLYRLHTHNLVTYHKKKDREKGWYISYWSLNLRNVKNILKTQHVRKLEDLKERLVKEERYKNVFFICPKLCSRLDFDRATEFDFKCPECGVILHQQENEKTIENIKVKIQEMEKDRNWM
ncbi:hypothetical protein HZB02_07490 [Candidatus Woesearchaeota archaeon]|nr:hypothetical protein [Candidatus Woesearchaeota archaeon]